MTEEAFNQTSSESTLEETLEAEVDTANEPAPDAPAGDSAELARRLAEREQAHADTEAQLRRMAADFENFRRRQAQERENLIKFAGERILERFLDVLDNFERAIEAGRKATDPQDVVKGVEMINRQLFDFLAKEGVQPIEAKGTTFDPNLHEAVIQQDVDDVPDQTVIDEFRRGYQLNGRVLRPAMVRVANNPSMPAVPAVPSQSPDTTTENTTDEPSQTDSARSS